MNKIKFNYKNNEKYNTICNTYLSYYVDPINKKIEQIDFNRFNVLKCTNYPNAIFTTDWEYIINKEFNVIKQLYKPNFLINFSTKKYNNKTQLIENIEFKENYKFMNLKLEHKSKYNLNLDLNVELQRVINKNQLDQFLKIVDDLESNLVTDKNKFIGLLELQNICHMYIIVVNNKYVGTGSVFFRNKNYAIIDDINVREEFRNKGLATNLMKQLINDCIDKKNNNISLFASEMGMSIYKKFGFKDENFYLEQYKIIY